MVVNSIVSYTKADVGGSGRGLF